MLSRELLEYQLDCVMEAMGGDDPWEYAKSLLDRGYLPPICMTELLELKKSEKPTHTHLVVIDSILEALGVVKYRIKEEEKRFLGMKKKVQQKLGRRESDV